MNKENLETLRKIKRMEELRDDALFYLNELQQKKRIVLRNASPSNVAVKDCVKEIATVKEAIKIANKWLSENA
jgi:hypothetical protein